MGTSEARTREPWPFAVAAALAAMIGVCAVFYALASANPDPPVDVERAGLRPAEGYVAEHAGGGGGSR
jgi:hypothetical protein